MKFKTTNIYSQGILVNYTKICTNKNSRYTVIDYLKQTIPRQRTLHTLTGSLVETCPVWSKEGPVVEHLTFLKESHAGSVVLKGHLQYLGILTHNVRGHQKQLQLDTGGKFREQGPQLLLDGVSVEEELPQVVLFGEGDWKQWHLFTADITNSRDPMILHNLL